MTKYVLRFQPNDSATLRLFCFPYAGASAAVFRPWISKLPAHVELCAVDYPGRVYMPSEPAKTAEELVEAIYPQVRELMDKSAIFFAHSYGSLVAYEVAKRLHEEGQQLPKQLIVSARRSVQMPSEMPPIWELEDEEFIASIQERYEAIPEAVAREKELLKLLLPILREDLRLNEEYLCQTPLALPVPVTVYRGTEDQTASQEQLEAWSLTTSTDFEIQAWEGGHFYLERHADEIVKQLSS